MNRIVFLKMLMFSELLRHFLYIKTTFSVIDCSEFFVFFLDPMRSVRWFSVGVPFARGMRAKRLLLCVLVYSGYDLHAGADTPR